MPARIVRLTIAMLTVAMYSAVFSPTVSAQDNQCVSCHFDRFATSGIPLPAAEEAHLNDWDRSTHAASDVSCDACHGGDPTVTTLVGAHERVLSQTNPASPVHSRNIPETCGGCHAAQFEAFQTSRHHELVTSGVRRAPTCQTCHGAVAARFPSTRGISSVCASCHSEDGGAPMSAYQDQVRMMRELIQEHRYQLALARTVIDYTQDPDRREALEEAYRDAAAPLDEATAAWHAFTFETAEEPLARAGRLISELVERLEP